MNIAVTLVGAVAGVGAMAGALILKITTTTPLKTLLGQQTEEIEKEYEETKARHEHFVKEILPLIPSEWFGSANMKGTERATVTLVRHGLQLKTIQNRISCGGEYLFAVPKELKDLALDLQRFNQYALERTTLADSLLEKMCNRQEEPEELEVSYCGPEWEYKAGLTFQIQGQTSGTSSSDV